jgi:hypothetical protein
VRGVLSYLATATPGGAEGIRTLVSITKASEFASSSLGQKGESKGLAQKGIVSNACMPRIKVHENFRKLVEEDKFASFVWHGHFDESPVDAGVQSFWSRRRSHQINSCD